MYERIYKERKAGSQLSEADSGEGSNYELWLQHHAVARRLYLHRYTVHGFRTAG